jgi:hypothetical protein
MSHIKNVEAFEKLIGICSGYGGYNPGKTNLTIQSLTNKLINAKQAVDDANGAKSNYDKESNNREVVFGALGKLASSIVFTLASSGASEQTLKDARYWLRQLSGRRREMPVTIPAAAVNNTAEVTPIVHRSPQTSYANKADQFANLLKLVSAEPGYQPNEPALQLSGLNQTLENLQQMNSTVIAAQANYNAKRVARNKTLYVDDSIMKTTRSVKKYARAAFGLHSSEYRTIGKIRFTKPRIL